MQAPVKAQLPTVTLRQQRPCELLSNQELLTHVSIGLKADLMPEFHLNSGSRPLWQALYVK